MLLKERGALALIGKNIEMERSKGRNLYGSAQYAVGSPRRIGAMPLRRRLRSGTLNLLWILVVILLIFAFVGAPGYGPWHHSYGWYPSGLGTVVVVVLVVLLLTGRL